MTKFIWTDWKYETRPGKGIEFADWLKLPIGEMRSAAVFVCPSHIHSLALRVNCGFLDRVLAGQFLVMSGSAEHVITDPEQVSYARAFEGAIKASRWSSSPKFSIVDPGDAAEVSVTHLRASDLDRSTTAFPAVLERNWDSPNHRILIVLPLELGLSKAQATAIEIKITEGLPLDNPLASRVSSLLPETSTPESAAYLRWLEQGCPSVTFALAGELGSAINQYWLDKLDQPFELFEQLLWWQEVAEDLTTQRR
jgi:hypothetical protein